MLRNIDVNVWVAEQPQKYFGLEVGTRMTAIRLSEDKLLVISPIQTDDRMAAALNQIGTVSYIIAPNLYHHLYVDQFKQIYPQAQLWSPAALREKRPDLSIDKTFEHDYNLQMWDDVKALQVLGFKTLDMTGASDFNEWVFFHPDSKTLIITDLAYYFNESSSRIIKLITQLIGGYQKLRPSLLEKIASRERSHLKQSIQKILTWDFKRVIMAHGGMVDQEAKQQFQQGYEWFLGESL
ncbi:MAG: DUF4336 domain-containing protein [Cyanothece sp. SIO2G6]|nr:DUF4336 domain-containing protein [Cyanothece sp. SIO2G6]